LEVLIVIVLIGHLTVFAITSLVLVRIFWNVW